MNFATTGGFSLGLSLLLGGLLLSTDYVLIRLTGFLLKLPLGVFALSLRSSSYRSSPIANDDLADASAELSDPEPAVVIRGKRSEKAGGVAAGKDAEVEEADQEIPLSVAADEKGKAKSADDGAGATLREENEDESTAAPPRRGLGAPIGFGAAHSQLRPE